VNGNGGMHIKADVRDALEGCLGLVALESTIVVRYSSP
jgi:hypothetical protein